MDRKDATKADFEPLYYKIEQFGRGVPENLQQRLLVRVEELDRETSRRRRNKMLGIASTVAVVLALVGVSGWAYARSLEVSRHVANLEGLLADEQLDQAEEYVANLETENPRVYGHPEVQSLIRQLESDVQADKDRRVKFGQSILRAETVNKNLSADNPASLGTVSTGLNALKDAVKISKTEMERAKVLSLREETQTKERQVQKAVDDRFRGEVAKFHGQVQSLDPDAPDYANQLAKLKGEAEALQEHKWLSLELAAQLVDPILGEIAQMQKQDRLNREEARYLLSIRQAIGDPESFRAGWMPTCRTPVSSAHPGTASFSRYLKTRPACGRALKNGRLLKRSLNGTNLATFDPKNVPPLLARAKEVLETHPGFPDEPALKQIVEHLKVLLLRGQGKHPAGGGEHSRSPHRGQALHAGDQRTGRNITQPTNPNP